MQIQFTKADWGLDHLGDLDSRLELVAEAGFDGIECFFVSMDPVQFKDRCQALNLSFTAGLVAPTIDAFRKGLPRVLASGPILINCHGGRDYHSHEESLAYFGECMAIAEGETDVQVVFETHRRCNLYSPWGTERLLNALPALRICADFSHFTCVSETDMETSTAVEPDENGVMAMVPDPRKDQMMDIAISRADHIHARVGDNHRPQVADPRIGEGLKWTEHYEKWWDRIVARARQEGREFLTINPEFGPKPYAPCYPDTNAQIADHWELAIWAMNRLRARYAD